MKVKTAVSVALLMLSLAKVSPAQSTGQSRSAPESPFLIQENEGGPCYQRSPSYPVSWRFVGKSGKGSYSTGEQPITLEHYDGTSITVRRVDVVGPVRGLIVVYSGRIVGSAIEGDVTYYPVGSNVPRRDIWCGVIGEPRNIAPTSAVVPAVTSLAIPVVPAIQPPVRSGRTVTLNITLPTFGTSFKAKAEEMLDAYYTVSIHSGSQRFFSKIGDTLRLRDELSQIAATPAEYDYLTETNQLLAASQICAVKSDVAQSPGEVWCDINTVKPTRRHLLILLGQHRSNGTWVDGLPTRVE